MEIEIRDEYIKLGQAMKLAGLSSAEMKTLEPYFKSSYGVPPSQEQMMKMLMLN